MQTNSGHSSPVWNAIFPHRLVLAFGGANLAYRPLLTKITTVHRRQQPESRAPPRFCLPISTLVHLSSSSVFPFLLPPTSASTYPPLITQPLLPNAHHLSKSTERSSSPNPDAPTWAFFNVLFPLPSPSSQLLPRSRWLSSSQQSSLHLVFNSHHSGPRRRFSRPKEQQIATKLTSI